MTPALPWTEIPTPDPQSVYSYRLADADHPYEFYWARNRNGAFALRFRGRFPLERVEDAPRMSGITTSGDSVSGFSYFNLVLDNSENAELFLTLCRSLMSATALLPAEQDTAALNIILVRLRRWQELLQSSKGDTLSAEEQLGLFGELVVLRDFYVTNLPATDAIACWTGPLGDEQDFGYSGCLLEVKTARVTRDRAFAVSSAAQLDTSSGTIIVAFQTVSVSDRDPPHGETLNGLVRQVRHMLEANAGAIAEFDMRLAGKGYFPDSAYDRLHFMPASRRLFQVVDNFPRIETGDLRPGVERASYTVDVNQCLPFEIDLATALPIILKGRGGASITSLEPSTEDLIKQEESTELEFKSSLRWSYRESKVETALEGVVLKTIAAFANTRGGKLVIGVDDSKQPIGLAKDYSTLKSHQDRDGFEQHLSQLMVSEFGSVFCATNLGVAFQTVDGHELCVVSVRRSTKLVPVEKTDRSGAKSKVFYVRIGNSSRELGVDEVIEYNERRR